MDGQTDRRRDGWAWRAVPHQLVGGTGQWIITYFSLQLQTSCSLVSHRSLISHFAVFVASSGVI